MNLRKALFKKPVWILLLLSQRNYPSITALARDATATVEYTLRIIQQFESLGIVETEKVSAEERGKKREIRITEKGLELAKLFRKAISSFKSLGV